MGEMDIHNDNFTEIVFSTDFSFCAIACLNSKTPQTHQTAPAFYCHSAAVQLTTLPSVNTCTRGQKQKSQRIVLSNNSV
jgi:hypothetical protein